MRDLFDGDSEASKRALTRKEFITRQGLEHCVRCHMGGGGDGGAGALRKQKNENDARIAEGMSQLNAVFGGGTAPTYSPVTSLLPHGKSADYTQNYYTRGKNGQMVQFWDGSKQALFTPKTGSGFDYGGTAIGALNPVEMAKTGDFFGLFGSDALSPKDQLRKLLSAGKLFSEKDQTYTGFTDKFYNDRKQAELDVNLPQLNQQYAQQKKGLAYTLANRGLLRSSAATNLGQSLKTENANQLTNLDQAATGDVNKLKASVEGQRANIIGQLESSADPAAALSLATGAATSLSAPSTFAPLGNLFSNWQNMYLANQVGQQGQPQQQMFSPFMFGNQGINNPLGAPANFR